MIYLILLAITIASAANTSFYLDSQPSIRKQIPLIKDNPYSCELVYFKVNSNRLTITIKQIPKTITKANITLFFNTQSRTNITRQNSVTNRSTTFDFDFSGKEQLKFNESIELNVGMDVSYSGEIDFTQKRKAYLIFLMSDADSYKVNLPIVAIIFTQIIGLLFIIALPLNVKYRKFLPFTFNIFTCFLYVSILVVGLYLQMIWPSSMTIFYVQKAVVGAFSFICLILYTQDLLSFIFQRHTAILGLSIFFAVAVIISDEFIPQVEDAWFLNNIIGIMVAGAFIKFVIIRRLKTAIWAIVLLWLFSLFRQFGIVIPAPEYDSGVGFRVVPLFLQIPKIDLFDGITDYACSAFGSSKIISFGVILNYCKRVDLYLSTHFYRKLGWILACSCVLLELGHNILFNDQPTMEVMSVIVFYPLAIILMLFFAEKRGEWAQIWHGSFYDMAVNRASIPRQVSFEGMGRSFGEDLLLNHGSIESE